MAKQTINIGSSVNKGDGDPLRTAFSKINDNFDELYANTATDLENLGSSIIPDTNVTYDLGSSSKQWKDLYVRDFLYLGNARLESDSVGNLVVNGADILVDGDLTGSVFADNSTLLVDGVNGKIVGPVEAPSITSSTYIDAASGVNASSFGSSTIGNFINFGVNASSINVVTNIDMLTYSISNATTISATSFDGDLSGSVFADNSTVLVDSVNGNLSYYPSTSSDWSGTAPTTVGEALDRLATVVKALNGDTGA